MSKELNLTEQDVVDYLASHPDFFVNKDTLLCQLRIPHSSGQATSLIERQLSVYRDRNVSLRQQLSDLLENARRNDELFHKTRRLIMSLIDAKNWLEIQSVMDDCLRGELRVEHWALVHITDRQLDNPLMSTSMNEFKHKIQRVFRGHRSICGTFTEEDTALLLGEKQASVQSLAATLIRGKGHVGMLSVGSSNPDTYRHSTDTLFLDYIGDVLALLLPQIPVT